MIHYISKDSMNTVINQIMIEQEVENKNKKDGHPIRLTSIEKIDGGSIGYAEFLLLSKNRSKYSLLFLISLEENDSKGYYFEKHRFDHLNVHELLKTVLSYSATLPFEEYFQEEIALNFAKRIHNTIQKDFPDEYMNSPSFFFELYHESTVMESWKEFIEKK
ncbi:MULTISPECIES: hypothetical protein [unclassified Psychrobacillus]|uniref:hypothetical protein n=1 Tax=unclassified Psychrobacillus TaxID=2636677 RepID=UPI0030F4B3FD